MTRTPKPTVAPPEASLIVASIPQAPPGLTAEGRIRWWKLRHFRNVIDAIRRHLQPTGTHVHHLNDSIWLYFNRYVAGRLLDGVIENQYASERSLFTRYSKDQRTEDNLHLATIGFEPVKKGEEALRLWNWYLRAHRLPEVDAVGTGLPDALRQQDGATQMAAASLSHVLTTEAPAVAATAAIPQATGEPHPHTSHVNNMTATATTESGTVGSGGPGPSAVASRAASSGSAVAGPSSTPGARISDTGPGDSSVSGPSGSTFLASMGITGTQLTREVESAIVGAMIDGDEDLQMALHFRRNDLQRHPNEDNRAAITRLAAQLLGLAGPRGNARDSLIKLALAGWDVDVALGSWDIDNGDGVENDDGAEDQAIEGQPPKKKQRLDRADVDDGEGEGYGKGKGKEK